MHLHLGVAAARLRGRLACGRALQGAHAEAAALAHRRAIAASSSRRTASDFHELHLAEVDQCGDKLPELLVLLGRDKGAHGLGELLELPLLAQGLGRARHEPRGPAAMEEAVVSGSIQLQSLFEVLLVQARQHLVEDVEVALALLLLHDARALEQVGADARIHEAAYGVEEHLVVLAEARGVLVPHGARVAEGLQDRVRVDDPLLNLAADSSICAGDLREVVHRDLRRLGLARAALAADHESLVLPLSQEVAVRGVRDGIRVRRHATQALVAVLSDLLLRVHTREGLVRIHSQQYVRRVRVDLVSMVPSTDVVQDVRIVQVDHRGVVGPRLLRAVVEERAHLVAPHCGLPAGSRIIIVPRLHDVAVVLNADDGGGTEAVLRAGRPDDVTLLEVHGAPPGRARARREAGPGRRQPIRDAVDIGDPAGRHAEHVRMPAVHRSTRWVALGKPGAWR
mmetsp:Transcript_13595/g.38009  ORF Transcript_13595/g.38009 Transcript_13595/m.38009 type:complete len:453 (+) Transcript_13595:1474-2832(+)